MAVPKRKRSRARRDSRHAHKGIKPQSLGSCGQCQHVLASHQVCGQCGYYKGRKIMGTKLDRSVRRAQARQEKATKSAAQRETAQNDVA
jgi:large subunit ribosomal protein L32